MSNPLVQPGRVLLTIYGVAVVISTEDNGSSFKARIWRHVGKSVASSTTAFLRSSCVLKELPAAPGMLTDFVHVPSKDTDQDVSTKKDARASKPKIMIHCYSPAKDEYTVSYVNDDIIENTHIDLVSTLSAEDFKKEAKEDANAGKSDELFQLKPSEIAPAKCAKFYPLIDELIYRGNEAASSAKTMVIQNPKLLQLSESMSKDCDSSTSEALSSRVDKITEVTDKVTEKIKSAIPDSEGVDGIYKMLKDDELTVLLSNGRDRLHQLISGGLKESTQNALMDMGLEISNDADGSAMVQARQKALAALDELLEDNLDITLETVQSTLGDKFGTMFDSLATAAKSDGALENILGEISEKTSEWQKETGRLLSTKSSSLFMEGAQRFHARVGNILSPTQLALVEKSGSDLTKAFTEGDVAVAKLKSIELGDSVRSRLFTAIEIRSETQGGLDSIIAGAISQIGGDSIGDMLADFKTSATTKSQNAHESLISLLSERSQYHDISIQKIERVLVDIESHLGEDMSPEKIASLARGEGGTAALFTPIAKRAAQEIEKQLDTAEESIKDERILAVISHVRKIMSGNLTLSSLVDEVANVLNSDDAVQAGTALAQTGEQILDALEGASENKALSDVFGAVEKAGFTKESMIGQLGNINVDDVLDTASEAVSDEKKRIELLSSATDSALEFLLKILPSMPVPPFEGVRDGLIYSIRNLSMHGFKLKKEDIMVEIAGIRAAGTDQIRDGSEAFVQRQVNAADILIVDVRNISAVFGNALWSFEQTYMPYLKGNGRANVDISEGHIRLEFELKKRQRITTEGTTWEPALCLKTRTCSISQLSISFEGASRLTWVANKLAKMLRNPLRDYVVRVIIDLLGTKSGWLLENLNGILSSNWDIILKTTKLNISSLDVVNKNDIVALVDDINANEIDLVWSEFVPLGINLLLNDKSGFIKVVDFPRGSQARKVTVDKELDPDDFKGATIVSVNGSNCSNRERVDILLALRDPSRPKTIKFFLKPKEKPAPHANLSTKEIELINKIDDKNLATRRLEINKEGPIGIKFSKSPDGTCLTLVEFSKDGKGKEANSDGAVRPHDILTHVNETIVIGEDLTSMKRAFSCLEEEGSKRPLSLRFMPSYIHTFTFKTKDEHGDPMIGGPNEFILEQFKSKGSSKICIKGYKEVDGSVESRGIFLGDHLIFINGQPVGTGLQLRPDCPELTLGDIYDMLNDVTSFPICLTFARPRSKARNVEFDVESTETKNLSVIATSPHQLGFKIGQGSKDNHFVVKQFLPVRGHLQLKIEELFGSSATTGLSFYSINGEKIPSYANCDIVLNAMKRAWVKKDELELVLCNEAIKQHALNQT